MESKKQEKEDYEKLGLKAGLEIHQQLNTNKLFCGCPSLLRNDEPQFRINRKLNPVVGETGEIDIAAEYEKSKNKTFTYEVYNTNCLVELDEEPPHKINREALKIALQISLLFNCRIFPVAQIMRKTVVDGSNTSGFQRTVLIAHEGFIHTNQGKVGIDYIFLEEDAARPSGNQKSELGNSNDKNKELKTYKLDRLGIPLVEIATGPHMHSPEQIKEAALKIGEILRSCNVKRGIGTIRQDLNISIKGSKRVEIKGFQDPKIMIKTIETEIKRQQEYLEKNECKNEVRKTNPDGTTSFLRPMPTSARMYPETDLPLLKISKEMINDAKNNLPKLASEHRSYLKEFGLNQELVKLLLKQKKMQEFENLIQIYNNPLLIGKMLTIFTKEISKKENKKLEEVNEILNTDTLEEILSRVKEGKISEDDIKIVMQKITQGESLENAEKKEQIDLKSEIQQLIKQKPGLNINAYMGLIMAKFKGKVSGKEVMDNLQDILKK